MSRLIRARYPAPIPLQQFGGVAGSPNDQWAAINNWAAYVISVGATGYMPAGLYTCKQPFVIDWGLAAKTGATFIGDGVDSSVIDLTQVTTAPACLITDSMGSKAAFYGAIRGIGFKGACAGPVLQVGREDYSDQFNEFDLNVDVSNLNATAAACAIELNGVANSTLFLVGNNAGKGDALRVRNVQFSRLFGSFGNADTGMHLTGGYVYGNEFQSLDLEVVNACVVIDTATAIGNKWYGGQFVWTNGSGPAVAAINATAGSGNEFDDNVNFASAGTIATGTTGIMVPARGIGTLRSGGQLVSPLSGDGFLTVDAAATNVAGVTLKNAGVPRWKVIRDTAGNLVLVRLDASGNVVDNPLFVDPNSGLATFTKLQAQAVSFFGAGTVTTRPVVTGSRGTEAPTAASLRAALVQLGLVTDSTTA